MSDVKFYMQECDKNGLLIEDTLKDLEVDFEGLRYIQAKGISDIGKVKNIYTETYSDSEKLRVWHPSEAGESVTHEATTITLELIFVGENRREVYESFNEFIYGGYRVFWDTLRRRKFVFVVMDSTEPTEDVLKGGLHYMRCSWKLQNLKGKTETI